MTKAVRWFLIGAAAGTAAAVFVRSQAFRRGAAAIAGAGIRLKKDAAAFVESIKEDAEDAAAEADYKASKAAAKKGDA